MRSSIRLSGPKRTLGPSTSTQNLGTVRRSAGAALIALALVAAACGGTDAPAAPAPAPAPQQPEAQPEEQEEELVPIATSMATASRSFTGMPLQVAVFLDTFGSQGLDMDEFLIDGGTAPVVAAVLSGEVDFGFIGASAALDARIEGAPVKVVAQAGASIQRLVLTKATADRLAAEQGVTPESPLADRIAAIDGLTIAGAGTGSTSNALLAGLAKSNGITVEIIPGNSTSTVAGMRQGLYDGGYWPIGVMESLVAEGDAVLWIDATDNPSQAAFYGAFVIVRDDFAAANPEAIRRFHLALEEAFDIIENDPARAKAALKAGAFDATAQEVFDVMWDSRVLGLANDRQYLVTEADLVRHALLQAALTGNDYSRLNVADLLVN